MQKLSSAALVLTTLFLISCGESSGGAYSALFGDGPGEIRAAQQSCTITVQDSNNNGQIDNADIQQTLNTARTNGQDDVVCIPAGTYNITSTLTYQLDYNSSECGKKLTIKSHNGQVVLDGTNSVSILSVDTAFCSDDSGGDILIESITFRNGVAPIFGNGGGLYARTKKSNIYLSNNTFNNNQAKINGGGAYAYSESGFVNLSNNTFTSNSVESGIFGSGGGIYAYSRDGSVTLANNIFNRNRAKVVGGGAHASSSFSHVTLRNNSFNENSADHYGGGAWVISTSSVTLTQNTFSDNIATRGGGAHAASNSGTVTLEKNTFINNRSGNEGGGGASAESDSGTITLSDNFFSDNNATGQGGGAKAASLSGAVILINNAFNRNIAHSCGGAFASSRSNSVTFINNSFNENTTDYRGSGACVYLDSDNAFLNFFNNIVWNNRVDETTNQGHDLYVSNDENNNNIASPVNLAHNIFSTTQTPLNFSSTPQTDKVYIKLAGNYNLNIPSGCIGSGNYGNIQADPLFVDASNGNLRLQNGSPAINAGCNAAPNIPSTDKDGNQRIANDTVDIGAYEFGGQQSQQNTLTVYIAGNGSGTVSAQGCNLTCSANTCTCTANTGTQITLTAQAGLNSVFAGWSNGTGSTSSCTGTGPCTFGLNADSSVTSTFNQQQTQPQPPSPSQPTTGGGGGGGCSMGSGASPVNSLLWLMLPALVAIRRLRRG